MTGGRWGIHHHRELATRWPISGDRLGNASAFLAHKIGLDLVSVCHHNLPAVWFHGMAAPLLCRISASWRRHTSAKAGMRHQKMGKENRLEWLLPCVSMACISTLVSVRTHSKRSEPVLDHLASHDSGVVGHGLTDDDLQM